ncbi:hypothetical protein FQN57_007040 [Myotisia sp. PD_48]|nr:hypothetical protein FQN57_007040 [Myotisia sp. PD_48]
MDFSRNKSNSSPPGAKNHEVTTTTVSRMVGNHVVFRIKPVGAQPKEAQRRANTASGRSPAGERIAQTRKSHRKSRTGCGNCKNRRVKVTFPAHPSPFLNSRLGARPALCDENKPECQRCRSYGISCDYLTQSLIARTSKKVSFSDDRVARPNSTIASMSMVDLADRLTQALQLGSDTIIPPLAPNAPSVIAFRNFALLSDQGSTLSDSGRQVMSVGARKLAFETPYLMHAIMATGCGIFQWFYSDGQTYRVRSHYHWQKTLQLYAKELQGPVGAHNMDGLMTTCLLLCALSFPIDDLKVSDSWIFSTNPNDLNWLLLQGGLLYLLQFTTPHLSQSMWFENFMETKDSPETYDNHSPGAEGLHPGLAALCEIHETTTEFDNPYHWPLRMLSPLLGIELTRENFAKVCTFIGRLLPDFTHLLIAKDPRATLILGYWLAKMCGRPDWWTYRRVKTECFAICMYLEGLGDPQVLALLEYPAKQCGYVLHPEDLVSPNGRLHIDTSIFERELESELAANTPNISIT